MDVIKEKDPYISKYAHLFVEQILNQSRLNKKDGIVKLKIETLAYQLRMDNYLKYKKWTKIKEVIERCLDVAKTIEFISEYKIGEELVEFQINYEKLVKVENPHE
jgi:hypothetical protein